MANVTTKQICVGCGVCAGVCPTGHLRIVDTHFGEYRPSGSDSPCSDCGLCLGVCPFGDGPNEDDLGQALYAAVEGIQHTKETGYFLASFVGGVASDTLRWPRTSGGLATWTLARLMETGVVDRAICVASTPNPEKLFEFAEFTTVESLWSAARSSYYPVEISSLLRAVGASGLKYAVIALPCVVKGIRRAQRRSPRLRKSIPVLLGLVCGQQRGKGFTEYLVRRAGRSMHSVRRVSFREKREGEPAQRYHFAVWTTDGAAPVCVGRGDGYGRAWSQSYFKQRACNYCDDVFAELADAAFMDAWLPKFRNDLLGTSIVIARSALCQDLLARGVHSGALDLAQIEVDDVIRSQAGALREKREGVALQISLDDGLEHEFRPRVHPASRWRLIGRFRKAAENRRLAASHSALTAQRAAGPGIQVFETHMRRATRVDAILLSILSLLAMPAEVARRAFRALMPRSPLTRTTKAD